MSWTTTFFAGSAYHVGEAQEAAEFIDRWLGNAENTFTLYLIGRQAEQAEHDIAALLNEAALSRVTFKRGETP